MLPLYWHFSKFKFHQHTLWIKLNAQLCFNKHTFSHLWWPSYVLFPVPYQFILHKILPFQSCTLVVLFVASLVICDAAPAARDQPRLRKVVRRRQRQNRQNRQLHFGNRVVLSAANPAPVAVPFAPVPVPRVAPTPLATAAPFVPTPALRFAHPAQFQQPIQVCMTYSM